MAQITANTSAYTVKSVNRGFLYYDANNAGSVTSSSHTTLTDATPTGLANEQFAFLRTANTATDQYYMYSIGASQFVTYTGNNGVKLELTDEPACTWVFDASGTYYGIKVPNTTNTYINITNWQAVNGCKVTGTGLDEGNKMTLTEVATELDLSEAIAKIEAFEADNTEAETPAAFAISNQLTAAELMAKTEPTYIAIKNLSRTNNRWFVGNTGSAPYSKEEFTNDAVFVWEPVTEGEAGSYRLKKLNGDYMQTSAPKDFGTVAAAAAFTATAPGTAGTFNGDADSNPYISGSNDANLVRFVKGTNWINIQNGEGGTPTYNTGPGGWTIHYVYELTEAEAYTASITNAGYSTFYVPANVEIPEGVKAYYITSEGVNDGFVSLTEITGVVPANTGVVLEGAAGEYTFNVSDADAAAVSGNLLKGTFASTNVTENAYVLSNPGEGVGLYKAATKEVSHSGGTSVVFLNNAGKAYLPASALPAAAQASNGFRFGEGTTGIENVVTENGAKAIFDLTGRRVEAISAPGIYIVNGKKVLVK